MRGGVRRYVREAVHAQLPLRLSWPGESQGATLDDDGRTRHELIAESDALRKRLVMLEASHEAELIRELDTAREEGLADKAVEFRQGGGEIYR